MKIGTKSLLFGIHQIFWHPLMVYKAWRRLYGRPSFKECVCIIIHDWGYWGKPNLDGEEGIMHPKSGALIADRLFGKEYYFLCAGHSRSFAKEFGFEVSKLCWADKISFTFEPKWFYLLRAKLSGELKQAKIDYPRGKSDSEWFDNTREYFLKILKEQEEV